MASSLHRTLVGTREVIDFCCVPDYLPTWHPFASFALASGFVVGHVVVCLQVVVVLAWQVDLTEFVGWVVICFLIS